MSDEITKLLDEMQDSKYHHESRLIAALRRDREFCANLRETMEQDRPFAYSTIETELDILERDIAAILKGEKQ